VQRPGDELPKAAPQPASSRIDPNPRNDANQSQRSRSLRLAVGIPTVGRPAVLAQMLARLAQQTRPADKIVVCAPKAADVAGIAGAHSSVVLLVGPHGLPHQRNAIVRHLEGFDVVVFFDDDFVPCRRYLENVERLMLRRADVVMSTGCVVRDGILGPGLTFEAADAVLALDTPEFEDRMASAEVFNGYGCNMGIRLSIVRRHSLTFDERLPLYAWLEDIDFSRQVARFGGVIKAPGARGIHLGIKSGRQSGLRLGYSQIANPVYLVGKGTCTWRRALYLMSRNLTANIIFSPWPESWVDRRGRLAGNLRAILDLLFGRLDPGRILDL
jgi:GT2 family glycosyltransferase